MSYHVNAMQGMVEYDMWDSRAEAKKAQAERLAMAKQMGFNLGEASLSKPDDGSSAAPDGHGHAPAEPKGPSGAFKVAVAIAQAADRAEEKEAKGQTGGASGAAMAVTLESGGKTREEQIRGDNYRLLGDLPTLGGKPASDKKVSLSLEVRARKDNESKSDTRVSSSAASVASAGAIPNEFLCAINGHVMKEPMRATTSGLVFERATIELWLSTRGQVCPLTNEPLLKEQLAPDDELKNRIMRYHIQQTAMRVAGTNDDSDLYDF